MIDRWFAKIKQQTPKTQRIIDFTYRLSDLLTKVYQLFTEVKKLKVEMLNNW
jgi:hypothetical protein